MDNLNLIFEDMASSTVIKLVMILTVFDAIFGVLRASKERRLNSTIEINGIIGKISLIISVLFLYFIDIVINVNVTTLVPDVIVSYLKLPEVGLAEFFGIVLSLFELTSIMNNLNCIGLPIPKRLREKIEILLKNITSG